MKRDTSVRAYSSACGVVLGYDSDVNNVLNACIAGYGEVTATITIGLGGLATVTTGASHNFFKWQVVLIAGATSPDQLNGLWKIEDVTAPNAFTMLTDYASGTTVTGTITVKVAPLTYLGAANNYTFSIDNTRNAPIPLSITNSTTTSTFTCRSGSALAARDGILQKANGSGETSVPWYVICNSNAFYLICISGNMQHGLALTRLRVFNSVNYTSGSLSEDMKFIYPQTAGNWSVVGHQAMLLYAQGYANAWLNCPSMLSGITYFGQNGGFFTAGVNPVNNEYVYYPIYATSTYASVIYMSGIYPGMLALLGTAPTNGIYSNMLHFVGSNGYGFCYDLRGPWRY